MADRRGVLFAVAASVVAGGGLLLGLWLGRRREQTRDRPRIGLLDCVGDTPLVELTSLSEALGRRVFAKLEMQNVGGTSKDRAARQILLDAMADGRLQRGQTVYEGSAGSTGISLALLCKALGLKTHICLPSDMAVEKVQLLQCLGATVERVPPAAFADPEHFCNVAQRRAAADPNGFFADQFDNLSNCRAHYATTGPELWRQMDGRVDALVVAAGTGGLAAGLSRFLKEQDPRVSVALVDPPGSSLFLLVNSGVAFGAAEREGRRRRRQVDTLCEGIGLTGRVTANFREARLDAAFRCSDQECVDMARFVLEREGLFIGSSSAAHLVGAVKAARRLPPGARVVTLLCDGGWRHLSKFWNEDFLREQGLLVRTCPDLSFVE